MHDNFGRALLLASIISMAATAAEPNDDRIAGQTLTYAIGLDGYCESLTITVFPWHQAGAMIDECETHYDYASGMEGLVTGIKPADLTLGESYTLDYNTTYLWNIRYPLATGQAWSLYKSTDGKCYGFVASGTYTMLYGDDARVPREGPPVPRTASAERAGQKTPGTIRQYLLRRDHGDTVTVYVFPWNQAGARMPDGLASGMVGDVTGVEPQDVTLGEAWGFDKDSTYLWNFRYPFVKGGAWSIYKSTDGANYTYFDSGTYTPESWPDVTCP
jgi:hypothetical protein